MKIKHTDRKVQVLHIQLHNIFRISTRAATVHVHVDSTWTFCGRLILAIGRLDKRDDNKTTDATYIGKMRSQLNATGGIEV